MRTKAKREENRFFVDDLYGRPLTKGYAGSPVYCMHVCIKVVDIYTAVNISIPIHVTYFSDCT